MGTTKNDMERIGLFKEMEYVSIKDPYKDPGKFNFNEAAYKNKQMMSKGSKERSTGSMAGYFETKFATLTGSYIDPVSERRKARIEEKKKNIVTKPFVSTYRPRDPEGLGSFYGTLGGFIKDPEPNKPKYRERSKPPSEKSNFKVNPPKKGTGFGYANLGIEKDPPYTYKDRVDKYDATIEAQRKDASDHKTALKGAAFKLNMHPKEYFNNNPFRDDGKGGKKHEEKERSKSAPTDKKTFKYSSPGKSLGGNKDGCFEKFPKRSEKDPYILGSIYSPVKNIVNKQGKTYYPNKFPKTRPSDSIINRNVSLQVTRDNYKQAVTNYSSFKVPPPRLYASAH